MNIVLHLVVVKSGSYRKVLAESIIQKTLKRHYWFT